MEEAEIRTGILKERIKLIEYAEGLVLETCKFIQSLTEF